MRKVSDYDFLDFPSIFASRKLKAVVKFVVSLLWRRYSYRCWVGVRIPFFWNKTPCHCVIGSPRLEATKWRGVISQKNGILSLYRCENLKMFELRFPL